MSGQSAANSSINSAQNMLPQGHPIANGTNMSGFSHNNNSQFGNSILSVSSSSTVKLGADQVNLNQELARLITKPADGGNAVIFYDNFNELPAAS